MRKKVAQRHNLDTKGRNRCFQMNSGLCLLRHVPEIPGVHFSKQASPDFLVYLDTHWRSRGHVGKSWVSGEGWAGGGELGANRA